MAHSPEPGVRFLHVLFGDMHIAAVPVDQLQAEGAPQGVTDRDAAQAAGERGAECQRQREVALINQKPGEREESLIGHRQADDSAHQTKKYGEIAVMRNPREDLLFHQRITPPDR
jgi:hypothetical protein